MKNFFYFLIITVLIVACGDDDPATTASSSSGTTLNTAADNMLTAQTEMASAQIIASNSLYGLSNRRIKASGDWTSVDLGDPGIDSGCGVSDPLTIQNYIETMNDAECSTSPFFDLDNALIFMCVILQVIDSTDGVPDVAASADYTISTSVSTACNLTDMTEDFTATIAVTSVSGTNTSRRITVTSGSTVFNAYYGYVSSTGNTYLNLASTGTNKYASYYEKDAANDITKFENHRYGDSADTSFIRILLDASEATTEVSLAVSVADNGASASHVRWAAKGGIDDTTNNIAFAASYHDGTTTGSYAGCIDPSDNSEASEGSSSCGDYNVAVTTWPVTRAADVNSEISALGSATAVTGEVDENNTITFTDSTFESAARVNGD